MRQGGKRVLVTGADGFIGSHLTEELVTAGYAVRAMVMYNSMGTWGWLEHSAKEIARELDIFPADIRDPWRVDQAVAGSEIVIHLASLIAIPYSYHAPDSYVQTNVQGTLNLLQSARRHDVGRFVHTSTSEVYGSAQRVPIDESHPLVGQSPYAASKIGADKLAESFHLSYDLPVVTIRPFNTYGPRQSARAVIPTVITQIAADKDTIDLGSLTPTRDFTYIDDTVRGFLSAVEAGNIIGEVINLGTGEEVSISDLVTRIAQMMNAPVSVNADQQRVRPNSSEVDRLVCDNRKAKKLLEWEPSCSMTEGLARSIEWFTDSRNLQLYKTDRYVE